jgi:hypothetical protein
LRRKVIIESNDFPMRSAIDYFTRVSSNIATQKFAGDWAPLNQRYKEWKLFAFGESRTWIMRGILQKSLTAFKVAEGWFGGVPEGVMAPGTSWFGTEPGSPISVAQYGSWLEYGRNKQPERPLFRPTLQEFIREGWHDQIDISMTKMLWAWR